MSSHGSRTPSPPRRSALFMPGSNARALAKARGLDVDVVIMDLEDAVAPADKARARAGVVRALGESGFGQRERIVRVNGTASEHFGEDVRALQGRELGFDGKTLIHPCQLDAANRHFAPAETELAQARAVLHAWAQHRGRDQGVLLVNGQLVEQLHVDEAHRLCALAERIASRTGSLPPR